MFLRYSIASTKDAAALWFLYARLVSGYSSWAFLSLFFGYRYGFSFSLVLRLCDLCLFYYFSGLFRFWINLLARNWYKIYWRYASTSSATAASSSSRRSGKILLSCSTLENGNLLLWSRYRFGLFWLWIWAIIATTIQIFLNFLIEFSELSWKVLFFSILFLLRTRWTTIWWIMSSRHSLFIQSSEVLDLHLHIIECILVI